VRFQPAGEVRSGSLAHQVGLLHGEAGAPRPLEFEVRVPTDTSAVEVWFEARGPTGTTGWDSRYGQNYTFLVADDGLPIPERSIALQPDAVIDVGRIRVVEDAASKEQITAGASGSRLRTGLRVGVRIGDPPPSTVAWADVHVFYATGGLVHTGSIAFEQAEPPTADAEVLLCDAEVYPGSGGGSGMGVWSRPDAHTIQYRLYCRIDDRVFTDGVLHQFDVPADTEVRPVPGGW
jgi:hypothetical protein